MMELEFIDAVYPIIIAPMLARAVGARDHQPMQYGQKYRALDRKFESALGKQTLEHGAAAALLPQPLKQQRRADTPAGDVRCSAVLDGRENHRALSQPSRRASEAIQIAGGLDSRELAIASDGQ